uniref:Cysteine-rich domain-containing protein n=1 Tax=uncultured bacterium contig00036 TaxID=1181524 RepID=A0A806K0F5_9BACT|nr:hypothetical protein [uncultured bacterium contig00036]
MYNRRLQLRHLATWLEKRDYIFRQYPRQSVSSLIFTGCYFPAYFPYATRNLQTLAAEHNTACAFDCCGKPLLEIGREADAQRVSRKISDQLQRLGVQELITVCPACFAHLKDRLTVPLRTVYEKLAEWGIERQNAASGQVFVPCPDRYGHRQLKQIAKILSGCQMELIANVPCCGLSGVFADDKTMARQMTARVKQRLSGTLYTYCASCSGQFQRHGLNPVRHLLAEILGVNEEPDTAHSLSNRWQFRRMALEL